MHQARALRDVELGGSSGVPGGAASSSAAPACSSSSTPGSVELAALGGA
jgi:hypothetical protein